MELIETIRKAVILFFLGFPLIMTSIMGFLSISLLNIGTFVLFAGQIIIVPVLVLLIHLFTWMFPKVEASDVGMLIPSFEEALVGTKYNVTPSYWVAHVVFLFSYIFTNAMEIYKKDASVSTRSYNWKIENRKGRATMIMMTCIVLLIMFLGIRYFVSGTETFLGILVGLGAFAPLGYFMYKLAMRSGAQNGDVFGMVQQMIPALEEDSNATICLPANSV
jgi:hypothetical protein